MAWDRENPTRGEAASDAAHERFGEA
jgi:hypothetical protein